jgi:hypothetical protein
MNRGNWWILSIVLVGLIALAMEALERDEFDPESLPPPAAGASAAITRNHLTCEDVMYSISKDGIKYVRESGGIILLTDMLDNKAGFYQLGEYGSLKHVNRTEMDSEASEKLEYALANCDAEYLPSGLNFAYR